MKLTAKEFRRMVDQGVVTKEGKRLKMNEELSPEFLSTLSETNGIFIPGEVYSSKNSKRIWKKGGGGSGWMWRGKPATPFITDSANVAKYKKGKLKYFVNERDRWLEMISGKDMPYVVEFTFYRTTKKKFDFNNMTQLIQDMMVAAHWVEDDDIYNLLPTPPMPPKKAFHVDRDNPGVLINVL